MVHNTRGLSPVITVLGGLGVRAGVGPTYVDDPLLDGGLAGVPVVPAAQLDLGALVVLEHGHHHCLVWREEGDQG